MYQLRQALLTVSIVMMFASGGFATDCETASLSIYEEAGLTDSGELVKGLPIAIIVGIKGQVLWKAHEGALEDTLNDPSDLYKLCCNGSVVRGVDNGSASVVFLSRPADTILIGSSMGWYTIEGDFRIQRFLPPDSVRPAGRLRGRSTGKPNAIYWPQFPYPIAVSRAKILWRAHSGVMTLHIESRPPASSGNSVQAADFHVDASLGMYSSRELREFVNAERLKGCREFALSCMIDPNKDESEPMVFSVLSVSAESELDSLVNAWPKSQDPVTTIRRTIAFAEFGDVPEALAEIETVCLLNPLCVGPSKMMNYLKSVLNNQP